MAITLYEHPVPGDSILVTNGNRSTVFLFQTDACWILDRPQKQKKKEEGGDQKNVRSNLTENDEMRENILTLLRLSIPYTNIWASD